MQDRKLKVTWLCLEWPTQGEHVGGVGRYSFRLAANLADLVDLTVVTRSNPVPLGGVQMIELRHKESRLHRYYVAPWKARQLVKAIGPDLVHSHGDDWLLRSDPPKVRSFYGSALGEAKSSQGLRKLNHFVLAGTEWLSMRRSGLRIGIAAESEEIFDCHVVMPPVVLRQPPLPRSPAAMPSAVFVGSHQGRKQGWLAERAVATYRARHGHDARLVVIGPASDSGSWAPWVTHLSGLDDEAVAKTVSTAWVLLSPSSYEGFGIPVIEGLHAGLPVAAMSNPGSQWLRGKGSEAVPLIVSTDEEEFVDAVQAILVNGGRVTQEQAEASQALVDEIQFEASAARLSELYRRLIP